jgi:DHA1 family bicyclomycin/chloramphenicol resistance-like MFS transporter
MQKQKNYFFIILSLMLLAGFGPVSLELYLPAIAQVAREFNTTVAQAQLTIALYPLGYGLSQLILGPLSDRFGRKLILTYATLLFLAMTLACWYVNTMTMLIIVRIIQAVGACGGAIIARAMVRDLYDTPMAAKVLSHIAAVMGFAPAVSPILGAYLTAWFGWRANFIFMFIFALVALLLMHGVFRKIHSPLNHNPLKIKPLLLGYIDTYLDRHFRVYCLSMCLFYGAMFALITQTPLLFHDFLQIKSQQFGHYFFPIILAYGLGSLTVAKLLGHLAIYQQVRLATVLGFIAALFLGGAYHFLAMNVITLLAPLCLYAFAAGIMLPSGMAGAMYNMQNKAGLASGLLGFTQMLLASIISFMVSSLYDHKLHVIWLAFLFTSFVSFMIIWCAHANKTIEV